MILFATIFGVGFILLLSSLIFGHDDVGGGDFDHADFDHDTHGPSIFSLKMIALLMVGFGAMAFGIRATTEASMFTASMGGVGGAVVVGILGYLIIRALYMSQASSTITDDKVIGVSATILDAIPENGRGQIVCVVFGREITFMARSKDNSAISKNEQVRVLSKTGNTVVVEKIK